MLYREAIDWLFSLHRFGVKLGLDNIRALTAALGRPQDRFESVLIAGTNGKGSTAAMLHQILLAAGVRSGLYTSPHLVRTEERIRLGEPEIGSEELASVLTTVRETIDPLLESGALGAHPTFFEVITAAALLAFARARIGIAVLEVGLGGRHDATNVVSPILSIITNIDLDHEEQLGSSLAGIAREKAGVLRSGIVGLIGETREEPLGAIRESAAEVGASVVLAGEGCLLAALPSDDPRAAPRLTITTPSRRYTRLTCPLPGAHQRGNVLLAVRAAEILDASGRRIEARAVKAGVAAARWPGRLEWIDGHPPLLLDGAHNPAGCRALADYLSAMGTRPVLVFAAMRDKDAAGMLSALLPHVSAAVFTRPPMDRAAEPHELLAAARSVAARVLEDARRASGLREPGNLGGPGGPGRNPDPSLEALPGEADAGIGHDLELAPPYDVEPGVGAALSKARALAGPRGLVLVAGSLFLVGTVKEILEGSEVRAGEGP